MTDENPLSSIFNPMEQQIGSEAYQSNLKAADAHTQMVIAQASHVLSQIKTDDLMREQIEVRNNTRGGLIMIGLLAVVPFYVLLFVYCVRLVF